MRYLMLVCVLLSLSGCDGSRLIAEFEGKGRSQTKTFTVQDDWYLTGESRCGRLSLSVYDASKPRRDGPQWAVATTSWDRSKSFRVTGDRGGTYYISVYFDAPPDYLGVWRIRVYQQSGKL